MPRITKIQLRRGLVADWAGKTLADGEIGITTDGADAGRFKIGDGTTVWGSLPYANPEALITAVTGSTTTPLAESSGTLSLQGGFARYTGSTDTHVSYPKVTVKSGATGPATPSVGDVWIKFTA
jgi:3-deoxy-D-manno-octulosonate 8-phosphate phosphatase KdsC-like HAD superfamily phosphatase